MTIKLLLFLINLFIYFLTRHACVRLCLVFNPLSTVLLRLEVFPVQVGCVYYKLGGSFSERHIVVSLSKTESVHVQKNITVMYVNAMPVLGMTGN